MPRKRGRIKAETAVSRLENGHYRQDAVEVCAACGRPMLVTVFYDEDYGYSPFELLCADCAGRYRTREGKEGKE